MDAVVTLTLLERVVLLVVKFRCLCRSCFVCIWWTWWFIDNQSLADCCLWVLLCEFVLCTVRCSEWSKWNYCELYGRGKGDGSDKLLLCDRWNPKRCSENISALRFCETCTVISLALNLPFSACCLMHDACNCGISLTLSLERDHATWSFPMIV